MAKVIANVSGVALAPGVSKNGRLYTREAIAKAVTRAQGRLADGTLPMTMLTHHSAEDDSTRIVGRVTSMSLGENGEARFAADIADTPDGKVIASLLDTSDGKPAFLRNVSIRGSWAGKVRRENTPDGPVETSSDLEFDGLDYTRKPGVGAAEIHTFAWSHGGATETTDRVPITESIQEARVTTTEETGPPGPEAPGEIREALRSFFGEHVTEAATPALSKRGSGLSDDSGRSFADPGYQPDKKQRFDLTTKAKAKAAWSYISQADIAKQYSGPQLKQVKKRIVAALRKFGVTVAAEGWSVDPAVLVTEALAEYAGMDSSCAGSYSLSATNGPTTVTVCSYGCDPADLLEILQQACKGAGMALKTLDPDMDADIDLPTSGSESAAPAEDVLAEAGQQEPVAETEPEQDPAPVPAAADRTGSEDPAVSETTTTETAATAPAPLTVDDVNDVISAALEAHERNRAARKAAKRAKAAPAETAPASQAVTETEDERIARIVSERLAAERQQAAVTETDEQRVTRLIEERMVAERQKLTEQGAGPGRKGLDPDGAVGETSGGTAKAPGLNDRGLPTNWPDKPLHEFTTDELDTYVGPAVTRHYLGTRADLIG